MKKIRIATIGTSHITEQFLSGLALVPAAEHTAVYSRSMEKGAAFARKMAVQYAYPEVFTDLEALACSDKVDAVYIASPNVFHEPQAERMLRHGKHVLCEKSIFTSKAAFDRLKAYADAHQLILLEAITNRHVCTRPALLEALKTIGPIVMARLNYAQHSSKYGKYLKGEQPNIFNMKLHAGALMDIGVYTVYGALDLFGMPKEIHAKAGFLANGADSCGALLFDYGDFPVTVSYSKVGQTAIGSEIIGEKGTLQIGVVSQYLDITLQRTAYQLELLNEEEQGVNAALSSASSDLISARHTAADAQYAAKGSVRIAGTLSKAEVMRGEIEHFLQYMTDDSPEVRAEYEAVSALTRDVHACMDRIKEKAGIHYPE